MEKQEEKFTLPLKKIKAVSKSPRKLIIFSSPKTGKTSALAELPNSLILDLERGTDFLDAVKVQISTLEDLMKVGKAIKEAGTPYKYIVIDTVTKLEELCMPLAIKIYKATPMGKNYDGDNILTLPNGGGYAYMRDAFEKINNFLESLAPRIIYVGHLKAKYIEQNGREVEAASLDLQGKLKSILSAASDAIGILYREGNKNILSFKTKSEIICGARPEHLKDKEIVLSELGEDGKLKVYWDKIFID